MDDLGFNKIAGAVLATGLGMLILMKLPGVVMGHEGEEIAYKVGAIEVSGGGEEEIILPFPQTDWVNAMDAAKGAKVFKKCKSCHNVEPGGAHSTGPALYGVVGNDIASKDGFKFSAAMTGLEGNWTYEALDEYLKKPAKYAPGTAMNFVGLKKPEDRAAVIEYLRAADDSPEALPVAAPVEAEMSKDEMSVEAPKEEMVDGEKTEMVDGEMVKEEIANDVIITDDIIKEKTEDVMKDKVEDVMKDKAEDVMKNKAEDIMKDKVEEVVKDKIKDLKTPE